jgi:hypothetical protein
MDGSQSRSYHRTTIYLTEEQRQWLTRLAAEAPLPTRFAQVAAGVG